MDLRYRLLNVFSIEGDPFSGNALCVFENASELDDHAMQSWARQFNLSETTFVTDLRDAEPQADVRIFTASYEMPFAGHPVLGTAHVVGAALDTDALTLSMPAGLIQVRRVGSDWTLRASAATSRASDAPLAAVSAALGLSTEVVAARWVNAGVEQLVVEVDDAESVRACCPNADALNGLFADGGKPHAYVWAWTGPTTIEARMFATSGSSLEEDPATGSAAANLGGYLAEQGSRDLEIVISQGAQVFRPSMLVVTIDAHGVVHVGGRVTEIGAGTVTSVR